ncbi:hypothetical protein A7R75_27005 [Mycolicibacterium llatzerense]|nr:hypothetical protein [Mycolicibacterium llatzerense]
MRYDLTAEPWIPVLTDTGMNQRSLTTIFDDDVLAIVTGDPLEDAAILRLLLAIRIAAGPGAPQSWVREHAERFDLFSETQPFGQNPDMARLVAVDRATRPLAAQSYTLAGNGSTAVNRFHTLSGITFSPAAAARLLLMRQAFSVGGIQQFPAAAYGKAPISAKTAVCTNRAFVWIDTGRLSSTLQVNADLAASYPRGTFHFGWPDPSTPPPIAGNPGGVLDALTWPSRSVYLLPADPVEQIMICDGVRWPEAATGYGPERDAEFFAHAVFERKTKKAPLTIQGVHTERVPWRQLLTGLAAEQPAGSVLAVAQSNPASLPPGSMVRIAGLGSYQARIDGPVTGAFPVPAAGVEVGGLVALLNEAFTSHGSYFGSLIHAAGLSDRQQSAAAAGRLSQYVALPSQLEPVATAVARAELTLEQARELVTVIVAAANRRALDQFRLVHVDAAGRVDARKSSMSLAGSATGRKDAK